MTELVLQIDNDAILPSLKKVLKAIAGVKLVSALPRKKRLYDPETGEELNDETMQVIERQARPLKEKNINVQINDNLR